MSSLKLIRVSSIEELDQLIDLACEIWIDDPIFSCVVPGRRERPDQYRQVWQLLLRGEYSSPGAVVMVACDGSSSDIVDAVGFAVWHRHGSSDTARSWQGDTLNKKLIRLGLLLQWMYHFALGRSPEAVSTSHAKEIMTETRNAERLYPDERWRLAFISVSPNHQRRGIGRKLVQWGLDRSEEEGVAAVLEASDAGKGLYEKMGFVEVGRMPFDEGKKEEPVMIRETRESKKVV
ncbi:N-acetyltransferase domain-containing protein [Fusarium keratoplasticum]|uniref:N-acetyltransferase domain-containing protein n=1 Tax=Fusarium keratoplasticum TaxID=1328300 RepID=A0ACC0QN30_9HYPO|nr:N-acetyltransferase domain-containing protein [Fusarium keratoplasticum]KAI8657991.1 N-acetyltransferase domain-containing protein [Fusarium keratoplasticum]KAI8658949.1 N-acetyltransferase domain-containing protein [Fusarium keratoplasticum]